MPWSLCGLVFYYCVTNYNKSSGLKQSLFISSQFLYVRSLNELDWVLCVWSHKTEIKVAKTLGFYLAVIGRNSFSISFRLLVDFLFFLLLQDLSSVFSCWLSAAPNHFFYGHSSAEQQWRAEAFDTLTSFSVTSQRSIPLLRSQEARSLLLCFELNCAIKHDITSGEIIFRGYKDEGLESAGGGIFSILS